MAGFPSRALTRAFLAAIVAMLFVATSEQGSTQRSSAMTLAYGQETTTTEAATTTTEAATTTTEAATTTTEAATTTTEAATTTTEAATTTTEAATTTTDPKTTTTTVEPKTDAGMLTGGIIVACSTGAILLAVMTYLIISKLRGDSAAEPEAEKLV